MGLHFIIKQGNHVAATENSKLIQKTQVQFLAQEDALEKETATCYFPTNNLAWEISPTEEPGGLQSLGVTKESDRAY